MAYTIKAACLCHRGRIRENNEDNFFFDNRCLEVINRGLKDPVIMTAPLQNNLCFAVFDGMGGENFGEYASFAAADCMRKNVGKLKDYYVSEREFLTNLSEQLNDAVVEKKREFKTNRMGTTFVALCFARSYVYVCNLGDSRAYRLRDGVFTQLTEDHVERGSWTRSRKPPLIQFLGIDPEEYLLEPYIAKGELKSGDQYLICSDGLNDMVSNLEISEIMEHTSTPEECVQKLIAAALQNGGNDNTTAIVCRIV